MARCVMEPISMWTSPNPRSIAPTYLGVLAPVHPDPRHARDLADALPEHAENARPPAEVEHDRGVKIIRYRSGVESARRESERVSPLRGLIDRLFTESDGPLDARGLRGVVAEYVSSQAPGRALYASLPAHLRGRETRRIIGDIARDYPIEDAAPLLERAAAAYVFHPAAERLLVHAKRFEFNERGGPERALEDVAARVDDYLAQGKPVVFRF